MSNPLYTCKCPECQKTFRTDNEQQRICPDCLKYRQPHHKRRTPKKKKKKILSFAQILHIAEVYSKIHHKYLHYGDVVHLVESNAEHCVCCGVTIPEGRQICPKCEKAGR